jgi:DUF1680 family protein
LFDNIANKKMYITGGIGSSQQGEAFGNALDLPSDRSYAESCAAIGLIFFASRMLRIKKQRKYADVVERALFNGAISGLALSGDKFFYGNLLACHRGALDLGHVDYERQPWFNTSCCPTSYCRFLPQIGKFCYRVGTDMIAVDIPVAAEVSGNAGAIEVVSDYPYDGKISVKVVKGGDFELQLRIPSWCRKSQMPADGIVADGYWKLRKVWQDGEIVEYTLDMPVEKVRTLSPNNAGRAALCRGPLVYCVELPYDSKYSPFELQIPAEAEFTLTDVPGLLPGTKGISFTARAGKLSGKELYDAEALQIDEFPVTAIPYALWQNRELSEMSVFLPAEM